MERDRFLAWLRGAGIPEVQLATYWRGAAWILEEAGNDCVLPKHVDAAIRAADARRSTPQTLATLSRIGSALMAYQAHAQRERASAASLPQLEPLVIEGLPPDEELRAAARVERSLGAAPALVPSTVAQGLRLFGWGAALVLATPPLREAWFRPLFTQNYGYTEVPQWLLLLARLALGAIEAAGATVLLMGLLSLRSTRARTSGTAAWAAALLAFSAGLDVALTQTMTLIQPLAAWLAASVLASSALAGAYLAACTIQRAAKSIDSPLALPWFVALLVLPTAQFVSVLVDIRGLWSEMPSAPISVRHEWSSNLVAIANPCVLLIVVAWVARRLERNAPLAGSVPGAGKIRSAVGLCGLGVAAVVAIAGLGAFARVVQPDHLVGPEFRPAYFGQLAPLSWPGQPLLFVLQCAAAIVMLVALVRLVWSLPAAATRALAAGTLVLAAVASLMSVFAFVEAPATAFDMVGGTQSMSWMAGGASRVTEAFAIILLATTLTRLGRAAGAELFWYSVAVSSFAGLGLGLFSFAHAQVVQGHIGRYAVVTAPEAWPGGLELGDKTLVGASYGAACLGMSIFLLLLVQKTRRALARAS
jgi:hypothetical protein